MIGMKTLRKIRRSVIKRMKEDEYLAMVEDSFKRRIEIHQKKSHDYASTAEVLGNFKRVASICKALRVDPGTSYGMGIVYIILKIDRLCNLIFSGKTPKNESLKDTIDDLKNYVDLTEGCIVDDFLRFAQTPQGKEAIKRYRRRRWRVKGPIISRHHTSYDPEIMTYIYTGEHWIITNLLQRTKHISKNFIQCLEDWIAQAKPKAVDLTKKDWEKQRREAKKHFRKRKGRKRGK